MAGLVAEAWGSVGRAETEKKLELGDWWVFESTSVLRSCYDRLYFDIFIPFFNPLNSNFYQIIPSKCTLSPFCCMEGLILPSGQYATREPTESINKYEMAGNLPGCWSGGLLEPTSQTFIFTKAYTTRIYYNICLLWYSCSTISSLLDDNMDVVQQGHLIRKNTCYY